MTLQELKEWGEGREFSKEPLRLYSGVRIIDREKFFKSHVSVLEQVAESPRKKYFLPYYDKLLKFYNLVNEEQKSANVR